MLVRGLIIQLPGPLHGLQVLSGAPQVFPTEGVSTVSEATNEVTREELEEGGI